MAGWVKCREAGTVHAHGSEIHYINLDAVRYLVPGTDRTRLFFVGEGEQGWLEVLETPEQILGAEKLHQPDEQRRTSR